VFESGTVVIHANGPAIGVAKGKRLSLPRHRAART